MELPDECTEEEYLEWRRLKEEQKNERAIWAPCMYMDEYALTEDMFR